MKRKFLEDLGLEKEIIDSIMAENGKDVEKAKGDYDDLKEQLETATTTIADLKKNNTDNEKLQATITDHEATIAKLQQEATEKDFNYRLEDALKGSKAKNIKAIKALLDMDKVKLDGDSLTGLEEQLKALQTSDSYLFEASEPQQTPPPQLGGAKPTNTGGAPKGITKDQFQKMSYTERVELYNTQPEVYSQLTQ